MPLRVNVLNVYMDQENWSFLRQYIKHKKQCFIGISTHQEESRKYDAQQSIFDEIRGVWIGDETLSRVLKDSMSASVSKRV